MTQSGADMPEKLARLLGFLESGQELPPDLLDLHESLRKAFMPETKEEVEQAVHAFAEAVAVMKMKDPLAFVAFHSD